LNSSNGVKTKVAVSSPDPRVDPVVSCVGPDANRVQDGVNRDVASRLVGWQIEVVQALAA
jgi:transcription antitermination factor NusA-like protein